MDKKNNRFNLRLDDDMLLDLNAISEIMGFNKAQFARMLLKNGLTYFKKKYSNEIPANLNNQQKKPFYISEEELKALEDSIKHLK
jgi:antitoxin component of RelBE/YafQ-DinJ toxin-antitoxin module